MTEEVQYIGFWARFVAFIIDSIVVSLLLAAVGAVAYSSMVATTIDYTRMTVEALIAAAIFLLFWIYRNATPGKMIFSAVIVDADTYQNPRLWQYLVRYLGYYVSLLPLGLGFIWIGLDKRKQGWHDKMAGTVVIRAPATHDDAAE